MSTTVAIPGLGEAVIRSIPGEVVSEALILAQEAEELRKADAFSNSVLSGMLVEPQVSPDEIASLPSEVTDALMEIAVDRLGIREAYESTSLTMLSSQRLYAAALEKLQRAPGPGRDPALLRTRAQHIAISASRWDSTLDATGVLDRLFEGQPSITLPTLEVPVIDPSVWASAFDVSEQILTALEPLAKTHRYLGDQLVDQVQGLLRGQDAMFQQISAHLAAFQVAAQRLSDLGVFRELAILLDATEAFRKSGWPLTPSMPIALRERVVELYQQGKVRYAGNVIMGHYRKNNQAELVAAVEAWNANELVVPRMHIVRDALYAHREGLYTLSVPALMPQIEGVLTDYVVRYDLLEKLSGIRTVYKAVIGDPEERGLAEWGIATTLLHQLETSTYTRTDFSRELKKVAERREVTRHTVAHGVNYRYDRPIHSLKVFLILDAISALQPPV